MEGNPHVDINKEQKIDSKTVNRRFFVKSQRGHLQRPPGIFFSLYERYY